MKQLRQHGNTLWATAGLLFFCIALPARPEGEFRTFTNTENRVFEGKLIDYNAIDEVVRIQRADGKTGDMPLSVFSAEDHAYIRNWGYTNGFRNGLSIGAYLKAATVSTEETELTDVTKTVKDFQYDLRLKNQSTMTFKDIDIEYCIFYRQGLRDGYTITYDEGTCHGRFSNVALEAGESQIMKSKPIRLYSAAGYQTMFGNIEMSDAAVRGIWIRLSTKLPSGETLTREYRTADDEFWKWKTHSIGAGLNKGDAGQQYYIVK